MTYSEKMLEALEKEDLIEAQLMFHEALKSDGDDVLQALAEELLSRGFLDESEEILKRLAEKTPEKSELYIPLAEIAIENNAIDAAFEYLDRVYPQDACYPESLLVAADLYQVLDMPEVSEMKLKEAQKLLPDESILEFALGELYYTTERFEEALMSYQKLKSEGIEDFPGILMDERIGASLSMLGKFEEAVPFLEAAVEKSATDDRLFQLGFIYFQMKEYQKAIDYFQQLQVLNPEYQSLYLYLAEALQEEERLEEAQLVLEEGIEMNPYQVDLLHLAAENTYRLHDPQASEDYLKQALELDDKHDDTLLTLSNLYLNEGRFEEVIDTIEEMEESGNPYAEWNLAHAYDALEDYDTAAVHYDQAALELEHEPDFLKEYGIFLREEGQLEKAKKMLSHYLHHEPGDMEVVSILDDLERGDEDEY